MKASRYALPAAAALASHAFLLFGFSAPQLPPLTIAANESTPAQPEPRMQIVPIDLDDPVSDEHLSSAQNAVPVADLPRLPDIPRQFDPHDIVVPCELMQPRIVADVSRIGPNDNIGLPPGAGSGPFKTDELVNALDLDAHPRTRLQVAPAYPHALRQAGVTGVVEVEFVVDRRGYVHEVRVVRASSPEFVETTLQAVAHWRFEPGLRHGVPVNFRMRVPVKFEIDGRLG